MKRQNYLIPLVIVVLILVYAAVKRTDEVPEYSDSRIMMDTFVEIRVWGRGDVSAEAGVDSAFAAMALIADLLGDGLIFPAEAGVLRTSHMDSIMAISRHAWRVTGGLFDPTIGAVSRLWEFYPGGTPPPADSLDRALERVGLGRFPDSGTGSRQVLDIGGVAKGYALELGAEKLRSLGFTAALLNAGGDIKIVGSRPGRKKWRIAVRHPRRRGEFLGLLTTGSGSIATSGDYERFFICGGKRYHHILDPRDGMPSHASVSVTVLGPNAGFCDALATGLFVMGGDEAFALAESLPDIEAIFVWDEEMNVTVTSGISDSFERMD
jgi:thiamine biosynthesis lipoprotein